MSLKHVTSVFPEGLRKRAARVPRNTPRAWPSAARCSRRLGFYYLGPLDGHNLDHLLPVLRSVRDAA